MKEARTVGGSPSEAEGALVRRRPRGRGARRASQASSRRGGAASSRRARGLETAAECAVIVSVIAAPLMLGSVPLWSVGPALVLAAAAFCSLAAAAALEGRKIRVHPLAWLLLAVVGFEAFQLLPLPPALVGFLSPRAAEIFELGLAGTGSWPAWRPLSLDPLGTGVAVARHGTWLLLLLTAADLAARRERRRRLVAGLGAAAVVVIVVAFLQKLAGVDLILGVYPTPPGGWLFAAFVNPNHLGAFLDLTAPICLALALAVRDRSRAALWGLAFVLAGATCLLTLSRGGIVALIVALTVFGVLHRRLRAGHELSDPPEGGPPLSRARAALRTFGPVLLTGAVVAIGTYLALEPILAEVSTLLDQEMVADEVRWRIWSGALPLIGDFWATGMGRGAFEVVYPVYKEIPGQVTFSHAENQLIQAAAELGVLFSAALLLALVAGWLLAARRDDLSVLDAGLLAGLAGLAVHELTDFATSFGGVAAPAAVAFGLLLAPSRRSSGRGRGGAGPEGTRERSGRQGQAPAGGPVWGGRAGRFIPRALRPEVALVLAIIMASGGIATVARAWGSLPNDVLRDVERRLGEGEPIPEVIQPAMRMRPSDHMLPLFAASTALERGESEAAMRWINVAIHLSPSDSRGHLLAAEALARAGRESQALLQYRLAAEWGEPVREVLSHAALRYPAASRLALAAPDTAEGRREVVRFLSAAGRHEEAWSHGKDALESAPSDVDLKLLLARSASRLGLHDETLRLAREVLGVLPRDGRAYGLLAGAKLAMGEVDEAVEALEEGLRQLRGDVSLSMRLARVLIHRKGDPAAGLAVLDAMSIPSSDLARSRMHHLRGDAERRRGRTSRAMDEYRTAARFAPEDPRPWISMGDHQMSKGRYEAALESYIEARRRRESEAVEARVERARERVEALREFRARERFLGPMED